MRQRIPEQCARGAPTTAAVGYCSVLCGNGTATLPDSNLPHHSAAGWHACNHEKRGRCTVRHAARTFNQRCAASIVADDAPDGTEGYSRGTRILDRMHASTLNADLRYSGVLEGTRILDRMHASTLNADHAPCGMRHTRPTSDAQQSSSQTTCRMALRGTQGVLKGTQGYSRALG